MQWLVVFPEVCPLFFRVSFGIWCSYLYDAGSNFNTCIIKQSCSCAGPASCISLFQKLIGVQQQQSKYPNPLKRARFTKSMKTK